jgi:uncharacterized membrane protein YfcA
MFIEDVLAIWWVLPVVVAASTLALATGISGALFFAPFFLLIVGLEPAQAIGVGLMTQLFGTSFATYNYARQGVIDLAFAKAMLIVTIPLGMVGALLALVIETGSLQLIFGGTMMILAIIVLRSSLQTKGQLTMAMLTGRGPMTIIRARDGSEYRYRIGDRRIGLWLCGLGTILTGLMSAGLPEINTTQLMTRYRIPPRVAVATSITVLTVTVFFAAGIHAFAGEPAWPVVVWSVPGAILGAQIGPRIQLLIPARIAQKLMAGVFVIVGGIVIAAQLAAASPATTASGNQRDIVRSSPACQRPTNAPSNHASPPSGHSAAPTTAGRSCPRGCSPPSPPSPPRAPSSASSTNPSAMTSAGARPTSPSPLSSAPSAEASSHPS